MCILCGNEEIHCITKYPVKQCLQVFINHGNTVGLGMVLTATCGASQKALGSDETFTVPSASTS